MLIPMVLERLGLQSSQDDASFQGSDRFDQNLLIILATQVVAVTSLLLVGWRDFLRSFPWRVSWQTIPLGILGCALWVGICQLGWEQSVASSLGLDGWLAERRATDPAVRFPVPAAWLTFLILRFSILAILVPIAEEIFLRGLLLRYQVRYDWWNVSMAQLSWWSVPIAAGYGVLTHTGEILAAILWFGGVSIWVKWKDRFWDAVAIHAVTNLTLGIYVMLFQQWQLW